MSAISSLKLNFDNIEEKITKNKAIEFASVAGASREFKDSRYNSIRIMKNDEMKNVKIQLGDDGKLKIDRKIQQQSSFFNLSNGGSVMNKLLVGSVAGLAIAGGVAGAMSFLPVAATIPAVAVVSGMEGAAIGATVGIAAGGVAATALEGTRAVYGAMQRIGNIFKKEDKLVDLNFNKLKMAGVSEKDIDALKIVEESYKAKMSQDNFNNCKTENLSTKHGLAV